MVDNFTNHNNTNHSSDIPRLCNTEMMTETDRNLGPGLGQVI